MRQAFEGKLRIVRIRLNLSVLLMQSARVLAFCGALALGVVLVDRLLSLEWFSWRWAWLLGGVAAVGVAAATWRRRVGPMEAAVRLDQRLGLKERFSSALALAGSEDPFAGAAVAEAHIRARGVKIHGAFPLRMGRSWAHAALLWVLLAGTIAWMPNLDLLGRLRRREATQEKVRELEEARAAVRTEVASVRSAVKQLADPSLEDALASLDEPQPGVEPATLKREAIRKLADVADKLKQRREGGELASTEMLKNMLRRLRSEETGFSRDLSRALARGDADRAAQLVKDLQRKIQEGELSPEERKEIASRLQKLGKQLSQASERKRELGDELSRRGLDKSLAKLGEKELREALRKKGLSEEQIEEMMRKAAQCRSACSQCKALGEAMAAAAQGGEVSAEDLASLSEQLDAMEAMLQDLEMTDATLAELKRAMGELGEGLGQYEALLGAQGEFREGLSMRQGQGSGGPGRGFGPRDTGPDEPVDTEVARSPNKSGGGPVVASWYFQGPQVKGEAQRELGEVVHAAKDRAAEAISENRIPRRYEGAVKDYFRRLEGRGGEESNE
jgi:hypothetical protein